MELKLISGKSRCSRGLRESPDFNILGHRVGREIDRSGAVRSGALGGEPKGPGSLCSAVQ